MNFLRRLFRFHHYIPLPWLVAIALVICFFSFSLRQQPELVAYKYDLAGFPQTYMKQVETREFDPQGKLHYQLSTPRVTHYQVTMDGPSEGDYTIIETPDMAFHEADGTSPWLVSASTGRSESNGQLLRLLDNVLIQQQTPSQGLIQITTSELLVRPGEQFAETDKAVKMRSAKGQIDAVGMDADLAQSRLQLKSQVKAVYDPR
ncbi:MAG TPA: LPS export ABC transporter periplasmic protein LptC [Cellvibrio sp.]|nr:LPS export ABC transporter periplasmic protein LptC [Cellvibrio sp.]